MDVLDVMKLHGSEREVESPNLGAKTIGMEKGMTRTIVHPSEDFFEWKGDGEACYCIKGHGELRDRKGAAHPLKPGTFYTVAIGEKYYLKVNETIVLICVKKENE